MGAWKCTCDECVANDIGHKDFVRDHGSDGWDETPRRVKPGRSNAKRKRKRTGCPENNNGPHVYVWITERHIYPNYGRGEYAYDVDYYLCCGCLRRHPSKMSRWRKVENYDS